MVKSRSRPRCDELGNLFLPTRVVYVITVSLFFYGTHIGGYGGWLMDDDGRILTNLVGFNSRTAFSKEADNVLRFDVPVSAERKVYSFVSWAEHGSYLRMSGNQIFSIHRKYFAE